MEDNSQKPQTPVIFRTSVVLIRVHVTISSKQKYSNGNLLQTTALIRT